MKPSARIILRMLLPVILLCGLQSTATAQGDVQAVFDEANRELVEENYHAALNRYRSLENGSRISGALFLNMGIAHSHIDSLGMAKYYFLKARRFPETRQTVAEALEVLENRFSRQSAVLPGLPWEVATEWIITRIGVVPLFASAVLLVNLGMLLYVSRWFLRRREKWLYRAGVTLLSAGLFLLALGFYTRYLDTRYSEAVMVTAESRVYEQPQPEAPIVSQAFEGYDFTVDHRRSRNEDGWKYVRMSNGTYGWIPGRHIRIL